MPSEIVVTQVSGEPRLGRELRFAKDRVTFGREPDNDVVLPGEEGGVLSRRHAELFVGPEGVLHAKDLGSREGTFVNGVRVKGSVRLRPRDVVSLGDGGPTFFVRLELDSRDTRTPGPAPVTLARAPRSAPAPAAPPVHPSPFATVVSEVVRRERSRTLSLLGVLLAGALAGALLLVLWARGERAHSDEQLHRLESKLAAGQEQIDRLTQEIARRDRELADLREKQGVSDSDRASLVALTESKLQDLRAELRQDEERLRSPGASDAGAAWPDIVERAKASIFLCVRGDREIAERGFGTAFAISPDGILATNAHVVASLKQAPVRFVVQNETGKVFKVLDLIENPAFTGVKSPDVGLLRIDTKGARLAPLTLATDDDLKKLRIGTHLGTLGFPGELAPSYFSGSDGSGQYPGVIATFKDGWIGRMTDYREQSAEFERATYIQHSASLTSGTSGSPMFTADGKVVAINNAGSRNAAAISFAIRVDELRRFWEEAKW